MSAQLEQISSTALAPAQRAAIALDSAKHRTELGDLVKKSAGIVAVLNADGRDEAHRAGMVLKNARINIQNRGKEAREDATAFSKAVINEEAALVDLIVPEERREQCTRLAMTWADRVSFVLTESLTVKRLAPLDLLKETEGATTNDDERFDTDFALMAGELAKMLDDLVSALGGEMNAQTAWVQKNAQKAV